MTWATRRRILISCIVILVIGGAGLWRFYADIFKQPTCSDAVMNGTETGVDCGGSCTKICQADVKPPTILWKRAFPVANSVYNAAAYVENKNAGAARNLPYEFRLYDDKDILAARVQGTVTIPPRGRFAIVETGINVGVASVQRVEFEFAKNFVAWETVPDSLLSLYVTTNGETLATSSTVQRLSATIHNPSPTVTLANTVFAAILYDANDNAINVSRTIIPELKPESRTQVYFTWPRPFGTEVVRSEIVPLISLFEAR